MYIFRPVEECAVPVELLELQLQNLMMYYSSTCVGVGSQRSFGQWVNFQQ